jgi:hypothetical protein
VTQEPARRRAYNAAFAQVRRILWEDWDPIGCGVPEDEYDSYAPGVIRLLGERVGRDALVMHLKQVAADAMSCPISEEHAMRVADKLLALSALAG